MVVDHINHDGLDNRRKNLRVCTKQNNDRNKKRLKRNTSGVCGVSWKKDIQKWKAYITVNHKQIHLGYYTNKEDAIKARKEAEIKYFGEYRYKGEDNNE